MRRPRHCHRWRQAGLITALGPRNVGVYFNLVAERQGPQTQRAEAVGKLLRRPVLVVGGTALHAHGWTTQQHHTLQLAVPVTREVRSLPTLDHGIRLLPRSVRHFRRLAEGAAPGVEGFLVAAPEMALADAVLAEARGTGARQGRTMGWTPTPDEIEPDSEGAWELVRAALLRLGALPEEAAKLLQPFHETLGDACRAGSTVAL